MCKYSFWCFLSSLFDGDLSDSMLQSNLIIVPIACYCEILFLY
ncbi:hypothetical protein BAP_2278 [Bacillus sp. CN2]|nr:hypothetical protein BAP_2278 [Bacillus sp. CN2]